MQRGRAVRARARGGRRGSPGSPACAPRRSAATARSWTTSSSPAPAARCTCATRPRPRATSSLAIARLIADEADAAFGLLASTIGSARLGCRRSPHASREPILIEARRARRRARLLHGDLPAAAATRSSACAEEFVQDNHSRSRVGVVCAECTSSRGRRSSCAARAGHDPRRARGHPAAARPASGSWEGFELSDANGHQLYCPDGFAHGFCVLSEVADVIYKVSTYYDPAAESGFRYDDPEVGIEWPDVELAPSAARPERGARRSPRSCGSDAVKAVILAGGLGTRISEETAVKPKPMIEIGAKPLLWHIMKIYSAHGHRRVRGLPRLPRLRDQGVLRQLLPAHGRRDLRHEGQPHGGAPVGRRAVEGHADRHRRRDR